MQVFELNRETPENSKGLKKIISLVSLNRGIRKGEVDGVDYHFVLKNILLNKKDKNLLMQYTERNDVHYGYEKSSFTGVKELIVLCAESGAGKDTVMEYITTEYASSFTEETAFLFSVPDTLNLFIDFARDNDIKIIPLFIDVEKEERLKRIIVGDLKDKYPALILKVTENLSVEANIIFDKEDVAIVKEARNRVNRFDIPFVRKIRSLRRDGSAIGIIKGTEKGLASTGEAIMEFIKLSRNCGVFSCKKLDI